MLQTLRGERPKTKVTPEVKKNFFVIAIQIIFLYSTKNGHSEKLSTAPNTSFSQSLSHMLAECGRGRISFQSPVT